MKIGATLEQARAAYLNEIRKASGARRAATSTPGKEATYAAKLAEARSVTDPWRYDEAYYETAWPYTYAEMRRRGCSITEAVTIIIGNANRVAGDLARIDGIELDAVAELKAATDMAGLNQARKKALERFAREV